MEGKNKRIDQQKPASAWPKNSIDMGPLSFMSPSNLRLAPSSFLVTQKPYFMNHVGAGSSSSGNKICFFQASNPLSLGGENNKKSYQNPSSQSDQFLTLNTSAGDNTVETEVVNGVHGRRGRSLDPNMDPRKLKRVISNRLSAQKSRIKKLQYVTEMERKVESLETLIAVLSVQVEVYTNKKYLLQMEQENLNQRMTACDNHKIIVEAEIEERREEVIRLRQLHLTQQQQKVQALARMAVWERGLTEPVMNPGPNQSGIGQTMNVNSNQAAEENIAEIYRLNHLSLKQQQGKPGQNLMPGLEQSELGQVQSKLESIKTAADQPGRARADREHQPSKSKSSQ